MLNIQGMLMLIEKGIFKNLDDVKKAMMDEVAKARAEGDGDAQKVMDRWMEGEMHKLPSKMEIRIGPTQMASGGGVEKMIGDYSKPTPQEGITLTTEGVGEMLGSMRGYMKSLGEAVLSTDIMVKSLGEGVTALIKANQEKDPDEDIDEEDTAKSFITRAVALIAKATEFEEAAGSLAGKAKARMLAKAEAERDRAIDIFAKALKVCKALDDADGRKAILKALKKSDVEVTEVEDEEEDEEKKKARIAAVDAAAKAKEAEDAAAKAKADADAEAAAKAAGGAADPKIAEALAGISASLKSNEDLVQKALSGQAMLVGTVQTLMDTIGGKSTTKIEIPDLAKGGVVLFDKIVERINNAHESGVLDDHNASRAQDLLGKLQAASVGSLDGGVVKALIESAPLAVQEVLKIAA